MSSSPLKKLLSFDPSQRCKEDQVAQTIIQDSFLRNVFVKVLKDNYQSIYDSFENTLKKNYALKEKEDSN